MAIPTLCVGDETPTQALRRRHAVWRTVWNQFFWITIAGSCLALGLAILVTPQGQCLAC